MGVSSQIISDGIKLLHSVALVSLLKPSPDLCILVGFLPLLLLFSVGNPRAAKLSQDNFLASFINNYHIQQVTLAVHCSEIRSRQVYWDISQYGDILAGPRTMDGGTVSAIL